MAAFAVESRYFRQKAFFHQPIRNSCRIQFFYGVTVHNLHQRIGKFCLLHSANMTAGADHLIQNTGHIEKAPSQADSGAVV